MAVEEHSPTPEDPTSPIPVPVLPMERPTLRADAARNRTRLLEAAAELFRRAGVEGVSLDEVVAAAGVGKGTLYRIFGDKSGLAVALLDERERTLQQGILSGPPPLGPGAAPSDRLRAFIVAYVRYVSGHLELVRMSQTARVDARFRTGSHQFWRSHLAYLLSEGGAERPRFFADLLLAAMTAEQLAYWIHREGYSPESAAEALTDAGVGLIQHGEAFD